MGNTNTFIFAEDNNKKAKAYLDVEDGELTISVVAKGEQYDFVLSSDDLRLIDFLRGKINTPSSGFISEVRDDISNPPKVLY